MMWALLTLSSLHGRSAVPSSAAARVSTPPIATPPIVDLSSLVQPQGASLRSLADDAAIVDQIREACSTWGFFYVVNHGVDALLTERLYAQSEAFFALPAALKATIKRSATNSKGWYDDELTKNKRDWKEGFDMGAQLGSLDGVGLDGFNQWPDASFNLPHFESTCREYFVAVEHLARLLASAMSVGLGMPADHFAPELDKHTSFMRLNYYPRCPDPDSNMCISPHTDSGVLTVLTQSPVQALQVERDGEWLNVPPLANSFVINTGDVMQVWSNGLYRAPQHRVIAQRSLVRYSVPFFLNPNYETNYAPIPSTVTAQRHARYRPINWGKFRLARFQGDFADVGQETQISDFEIQPSSATPSGQ